MNLYVQRGDKVKEKRKGSVQNPLASDYMSSQNEVFTCPDWNYHTLPLMLNFNASPNIVLALGLFSSIQLVAHVSSDFIVKLAVTFIVFPQVVKGFLKHHWDIELHLMRSTGVALYTT